MKILVVSERGSYNGKQQTASGVTLEERTACDSRALKAKSMSGMRSTVGFEKVFTPSPIVGSDTKPTYEREFLISFAATDLTSVLIDMLEIETTKKKNRAGSRVQQVNDTIVRLSG